jgi:biotin synthase
MRYQTAVTVAWTPTLSEVHAHGWAQARLHEEARCAASGRFGNEVFIRGVVEVSNFCRENCHYCGMRRDNRGLDRYRASLDGLAELLIHHRPASITDLNIQTGEDPRAAEEIVLPLVRLLTRETSLGVSVCLGTLDRGLTRALQAAGAALYIIKFEVADPALYRALEAPGDLEERTDHIRWLASEQWRVSSGFIAGLPREGPEVPLRNLALATALPLSGCSVSPFVPGEATPLSMAVAAPLDLTLNCMACLRLMRPDWVIPAVSALDIAGQGQGQGQGYRRGLRAGANLCTINLTPPDVRRNYLLYRRDRHIMSEERVLTAVMAEGLTPSRRSLLSVFREQGVHAG